MLDGGNQEQRAFESFDVFRAFVRSLNLANQRFYDRMNGKTPKTGFRD